MRKPQSILFFSCQELFIQSTNGSERRPGLLAESPGQCRGSQPFSEEEPVRLTEASFCEEQVAVERWNLTAFFQSNSDVLAYQSFPEASPFPSGASLEEETSGVVTRSPPRLLLPLAVLTCTHLLRGARDGLFSHKAGK